MNEVWWVALLAAATGAAIMAVAQWLISKRERSHQLRLAALEKRLAVHQEAYALWRKMKSAAADATSSEISRIIGECEDWWWKNCLYLDRKVRKPFRICMTAALDHPKLVMQRAEVPELKSNWEDIKRVGELIENAVGLPAIGAEQEESEKKRKT